MPVSLVPLAELQFETAAEHHTRSVPMAAPMDTVLETWQRLRRQHYDSASEIVICGADGVLSFPG